MSIERAPFAVQALDYLLWIFLTIASASHAVERFRDGASEWWVGLSIFATLMFFANTQQSASEFRKRRKGDA